MNLIVLFDHFTKCFVHSFPRKLPVILQFKAPSSSEIHIDKQSTLLYGYSDAKG